MYVAMRHEPKCGNQVLGVDFILKYVSMSHEKTEEIYHDQKKRKEFKKHCENRSAYV